MIDTAHLSDVQVLACTLYGEARSEPTDGILGVANVIRNRVTADLQQDGKPDWWGEGYRGVCLASKQFSFWSPEGGAGNHQKLATLVAELKQGTARDPRFKECAWIATGVLNDWVRDSTSGATHYHVASMDKRPSWAYSLILVKHIGRHVFLRDPMVKAA